jgi:uncharacterized membrane protein
VEWRQRHPPRSGLANSINDAGQAVGVGSLNTATEWSGGSVINLANLPGIIASTAYDINDAGLVVGSSFIEGPCTLPSGAASSVIDLGGLPGYTPPAKEGALTTSGR